MSSTAISAQGTTLKIATGSGGAKTITAVAVGYPTILTSAAHGFVAGDYVTMSSGFTGANASALNGKSYTVLYATTNTFAVAENTTGLTITAGTATATPTTFTQVNNFKSMNGFDGQASEIDVTNLSSTAKEIRLGLVDFGQIQFEMDHDNTDAGQAALLSNYNAGTSKQFQMTLPNANVATFTAFVKQFTKTLGVDQVVKGNVALRISGSVTWA